MGAARLSAQDEITPAWSFLGDATGTDGVTDLWVSPNGTSYMLGHITMLPGSEHRDGLMFMKVDAQGQEVWRHYLHGATEEWMLMAKGIVGSPDGYLYIVYTEGFRYTHYTNSRVMVKKYNQQGDEIWTRDLTGDIPGRLESLNARNLMCKDGYLYMAGSYNENILNTADLDSDGLIYKIDAADGDIAAKVVYNSDYGSDDVFMQIKVDPAGNMYVIGRSRGLNGPGGIYSHYDSLTVKYDAQGNKLWESALNGEGNAEDHGIDLDIDSQGNTYTSSQVKRIGVNQRVVVIRKHAPDGNVLWTHLFQGSSSGYTYKQPVALLPNGNVVFVTANEDGINTIALNGTDGTQVWATNYNRSAAGAANHQRDMITDAQGNIYVTGTSRDNTPFGNGYDMVTLCYDSAGALLWLSNYNHSNYDGAGDDGVTLKQDAAGNVYAIGWTQGENYNDDFLLLKYGDAALAAEKPQLSGLSP